MLFKVGIFVLLLFWRKGIRIISFPAAALETHSVLVVHSLHVSVRSATDICMYIAYTYPIYKWINKCIRRISFQGINELIWSMYSWAFANTYSRERQETGCWLTGEENKTAPFSSKRVLCYLILIMEQHNYKCSVVTWLKFLQCPAKDTLYWGIYCKEESIRVFSLSQNSEGCNDDIKIPVHFFDVALVQKRVCVYLFLMECLDAGAQFCDSFKKTVIMW